MRIGESIPRAKFKQSAVRLELTGHKALNRHLDGVLPTCNHSAILQPGVVPSSQPWRQKLNQFGLLNNYEDAVELRAEYLAIYLYPPFDIYMVHKVEPE